jgi:outer membrane protein TolC
MAVNENINIKTARFEHEKSRYKKAEAISALMPQINVSGSFQDNISLPTTVVDGSLIGRDGILYLKMGANYITGTAAIFNMTLYNQTALTALQLSKKVMKISDLNIEKASEELAAEVAKLYALTVATSKQRILVKQNIAGTEKIQDIAKLLMDNGMVKQTDYERVSVSLENLNSQLGNVETGLEQQLNMIKYMLNIPLGTTIVLTDTTDNRLLQAIPETTADFSKHIDILLLESQNELNILNKKMINNGYVPSLSFVGQYLYQGQRQEFKNYFRNDPENVWFGSSYIGLNLSVPIFDGGNKRAKSLQAKTDFQKTEALISDRKERFTADYQNAVNNYYNHRANMERQIQNVTLAEKVYKETALKYREGMSSMSDLLQDETNLANAQSNYIAAWYNYREAELKIMSLNGEIKNLYK